MAFTEEAELCRSLKTVLIDWLKILTFVIELSLFKAYQCPTIYCLCFLYYAHFYFEIYY